jgi:hypothetical protein
MQMLDAYDLLVHPPAMISEKGMKEIKKAAPKLTVESRAWLEVVQEDARKMGIRGPLD